MAYFCGIFRHVHLTERGRRAARAMKRAGFRRILPVGVAAFAVAGTLTGALTAAMGDHPEGSLDAAAGAPSKHAARSGTSVFDLPSTRPAGGNLPVLPSLVSGALLTDDTEPAAGQPSVAPLRRTLQADLLVVSPSPLPRAFVAAASRMSGVTAAEQIEAVRMQINGAYTPVLGVDPSVFRSFAAHATAASDALWQGVADGGVAVSYTMGKLDKLPLGGTITAAGKKTEQLRVTAFGTLGIGGVNAVVSDAVARSLGAPSGNALVISTTTSDFNSVAAALGRMVPHGASVEQLVKQVSAPSGAASSGASSGAAGAGAAGSGAAGSGAAGSGSANSAAVPSSALTVMLKAAMSRLGMRYVWGGAGPTQFDCSGLVQWSFARAGIVMPRVAADQALTGPAVPTSQLQPGDLLFYHTDPTAPAYISHVAIYLGNGWMIQAPEPGKNVEVVPADFGSEFAGAVRVNQAQAAAVARRVA
jgi:cell wall-associated NlpC family hydrolase